MIVPHLREPLRGAVPARRAELTGPGRRTVHRRVQLSRDSSHVGALSSTAPTSVGPVEEPRSSSRCPGRPCGRIRGVSSTRPPAFPISGPLSRIDVHASRCAQPAASGKTAHVPIQKITGPDDIGDDGLRHRRPRRRRPRRWRGALREEDPDRRRPDDGPVPHLLVGAARRATLRRVGRRSTCRHPTAGRGSAAFVEAVTRSGRSGRAVAGCRQGRGPAELAALPRRGPTQRAAQRAARRTARSPTS